MPYDLKETLIREATDRQLSLSAYVISILQASLVSAKLYRQFPIMPITSKTLSTLVCMLDEAAIHTVIKSCILPEITEMSRVLFGGEGFDHFVRLSELFTRCGFTWFTSIERSKIDGTDRFTARHGLGVKFSYFIGETVQEYLGGLGLQVSYRATENFAFIFIDPSHKARKGTRNNSLPATPS